MLKIKDSVDLKELEKFGFKERYYFDNYIWYEFKTNGTMKIGLSIHKDSKEIGIFTEVPDSYSADDFFKQDVIFDLIQAGLVEKIEE